MSKTEIFWRFADLDVKVALGLLVAVFAFNMWLWTATLRAGRPFWTQRFATGLALSALTVGVAVWVLGSSTCWGAAHCAG